MEKWTCQYLIFTEILWRSQYLSILVNIYWGGNRLGICQIFYTSKIPNIKFVGEDLKSGLGGLVNLVTYPQILSHIVKYCHILSNICGGGLEKWTCQSCQ